MKNYKQLITTDELEEAFKELFNEFAVTINNKKNEALDAAANICITALKQATPHGKTGDLAGKWCIDIENNSSNCRIIKNSKRVSGGGK